MICLSSRAQKKWDGGANSSSWNDAANWSPDGVPGISEDVILDHEWTRQAYRVELPSGTLSVLIRSVTITPSVGTIELVLPFLNTAATGLALSATGDGMVINKDGVFINASGAASGNPVQITGKMRINNGGKYVHQTARGNAELIDKLNNARGTEKGVFEFNVPGTAGYTVSLTGNTFGSLKFSASAAGGSKSYSGSGTLNLTIRGDLSIDPGVSVTSTLTGDIGLGGNLMVDGRLNVHPVTAGTVGRSMIFNGSQATFGGSGLMSMNAFFRTLLIQKNTSLTLARSCQLVFTPNSLLCLGSLICGKQIVSGVGSFILADEAFLHLGSDTAISNVAGKGNIQTTFKSLSKKANYIFSGTELQFTGDAMPDTVTSVMVDNPGHLRLSKALAVTDTVHLHKGKIISDSVSLLSLLNASIKGPTGVFGENNIGSAQTFIEGPVVAQLNDTLMHYLPLGFQEQIAPIQLKQVASGNSLIRICYKTGQPITAVSPSLNTISSTGHWTFSAESSSAWLFKISYPLSDTALHMGETVVPAVLQRSNGNLAWRALSGQLLKTNEPLNWIQTDTAVADLLGIAAGYTVNSVLPLKLIQFSGEKQNNGIRLHWKAEEDGGQTIYTVERSSEGRNFVALGNIYTAGAGLRKYSWDDTMPLNSVNYYRLRIESNGLRSYSFLISQGFSKPSARLYPNPARDFIHINFPDQSSRSYLEIVNSNGAVLRTYFVKTANCDIVVSDLPSGSYIVRLRGTKNPTNLKFTKY